MSHDSGLAKFTAFIGKLEEWIAPAVKGIYDNAKDPNFSYRSARIQYQEAKNVEIRKRISSTHTWMKDVTHKYRDNWYTYAMECKVCGQGASAHEEDGDFNMIRVGMPTKDMHGKILMRTCEEVLAAKKSHRAAHKGGKCLQCNTYDCIDSEYRVK